MQMNSNIKYGLVVMTIWLVLVTTIITLYAKYNQMSLSEYFFDKETGGIISITMFVIWAGIWYSIGFHARKDYTERINTYKKEYPLIGDKMLCKEFKKHYFSRCTKTLSRIFMVGIPTWLLLNIYTLNIKDYIVMCFFCICALICYIYYKINT